MINYRTSERSLLDKVKLVLILLNYKDDSQNNVFYTVKY